MKTWILDDSMDPWINEPTASPDVHAVKPLPCALPDPKTPLEAALSDCEALRNEVSELNDLARRAHKRELLAVRRAEWLTRILWGILGQPNKSS